MHLSHFQTWHIGPYIIISFTSTDLSPSHSARTPYDSVSGHHQWMKRPPQAFPSPCWLLCECRTVFQWWAFSCFKNIIIEIFDVMSVIFIQLGPVIPHVVPLVVLHAVISCPNRAHRTLRISWLLVHVVISCPNKAPGTLSMPWLVVPRVVNPFPKRANMTWQYHFFRKYQPSATIPLYSYSGSLGIRSPPVDEVAPSRLSSTISTLCRLCECHTVLQSWAFLWIKDINIWNFSCDNCAFYPTGTFRTICLNLMSQ